MCSVVAGVTAAISVASAALSTYSSIQQSEAQMKAMDESNVYNAKQAIKEQTDLSAQEGIQQQQERQAIANERLNVKREGMQRAASAQASTQAEGTAYDLLMGEYSRVDGNNMSVIDQQLSMQDLGHSLALKNYEDRAKARIGGLQGYKSFYNKGLSIGSGVLQAGGGVLGAYNDHKARTSRRSK